MNFVSSWNLFLRYFIVFTQILQKLGRKSPKFETFTMSSNSERGGSAVTTAISRCALVTRHAIAQRMKHIVSQFPQSQSSGVSLCVDLLSVCWWHVRWCGWLAMHAWSARKFHVHGWLLMGTTTLSAFFRESPWDMAVNFSRAINAGPK